MIQTGPQIIASTHTLEKYQGRFGLSVADLVEIAATMREGGIKVNQQHDPLRPSTMKLISAEVEQLDDGENAFLKVNFMVDEDEWETFLTEVQQLGVPGGFSYTRLVPFAQSKAGQTSVVIAADAAFFTQDEISVAASFYGSDEVVELAELVQFSATNMCQVIVVLQQPTTTTLQTWGPAVVGGLIGPVLLAFVKVGNIIRYRLQLRSVDNELDQMEAVVETADREVLIDAIDRLAQLEESWQKGKHSQLWKFDEPSRLWIRRKRD